MVPCADTVRFAHGAVLSLFTSRRAFIDFLEIVGQIIAALTCHDVLPTCWIGFCDNMAGKAALVRGYGRDPGCYDQQSAGLFLGCLSEVALATPFRVGAERSEIARMVFVTAGQNFLRIQAPCGPFSAETLLIWNTLWRARLQIFCLCTGIFGLGGSDASSLKCLLVARGFALHNRMHNHG